MDRRALAGGVVDRGLAPVIDAIPGRRYQQSGARPFRPVAVDGCPLGTGDPGDPQNIRGRGVTAALPAG
jgi:hypothetical protein